ncbi:MAG TPA: hypothetical protein ENH82_02320 [bacterium]|nr:hypothetical protein [bacterium]
MKNKKERHKNDTETFEGLNFQEQANSITGQVSRLIRSVRAHVRRAEKDNRNGHQTLLKCIGQIARSINNLIK